MEVVVNEEKKKIFRARKTMKISDRQQLESLHNTLLTAAPGLSERSSPPLMNGTHKEDVPKAEDKEQNNVSGSNSPREASPSSPASLSSPAPFLSLNLSPSPASSQSPTSKDDAPTSPTSPFHSLNFELKKMEGTEEEEEEGGEKKSSPSSTVESVKAPSTESKENQEKGKEAVPEKTKQKEEHTTTDEPAGTEGADKASSSVDSKQEKDIKNEDIKEEEEDKEEDKKKDSTSEVKMEVESVKAEPKKEKKDVSQTTKPSRPSSTPPSNSAQEEKGSTSGLKRTLSEGSEKDGPAVKREGKRPKVEREELEAQLELKITANAGSHHKLEKIVQQLVDERLRVLELTIFDHNFKELKDRVDKIDCATKHQTAINTLQGKIARLAKKFGEANQASENKRKTEALAAAAAAASKTATVTTSAQPQRPVRTSMDAKQAQTVSSPSTVETLAEMQQMNDGDSDGSEISGVWSDEDQGSDSSFEAPQHKQKKMFVPLVPSARKSTPASSKSVKGRDGTVWRVCQPGEQSAEQHFLKVQPDLMGPTAHAKDNIKDAASAFLCLLDMKILEHIRDCTVAEAHSVEEDKSWDLSIAELKAFIALLYARGVYGKNMDFESFWSQEWGLPFFRSTIPRDRFREIMRYLRFEKKQDQHTQQCNDKFAPMSFVWDRFVNNSIACYQPGSCITVDKQPPGTSVRPGCTQKDKQKTNDIKFMIAADTETKYFLNGIPYLGSDKDLGEGVVMNLVEPFLGKGRNVTIKKCFTSLSLAKKLQQKNTSLVGVINQLKPELPSSVRQRAKLYSTKVLKHDQATLTVYQSRKRESVVLLSTMHPTVSLCSDRQRTPETVIFHDDTKAGVDALDQMAHLYSVKNLTPRRLTAVFYNLLDIAGVNAYILLKACTSTPIPRRAFSLQLAKELRQELMSTKTSVQMINLELAQEPGIKKHCQVNSHCRKNTTVVSCTGCQRPMCGKCTIKVEHLCHMCALLL